MGAHIDFVQDESEACAFHGIIRSLRASRLCSRLPPAPCFVRWASFTLTYVFGTAFCPVQPLLVPNNIVEVIAEPQEVDRCPEDLRNHSGTQRQARGQGQRSVSTKWSLLP